MGATVGPSAFFIGFTTTGLKIDKGHELVVLEQKADDAKRVKRANA